MKPEEEQGVAVRVEKEGPITTVVLARPEVRNAVDRETAQALATAFRAFEEDEEALIGILYGEDGAFCAGADLKAVARDPENSPRAKPDGDGPMGPSRMLLTKPVIAAIAGPAVAGGLELALWCDMRIAEEDAYLGVFCRRWGVPLIDGGTVRLPRLIGLGHAMDMILTGRPVAAQEALAMGLVNRVVPKGEALAAAKELAEQLVRFPQTCMRADRMSAYKQFGLSLEEAMANEFQGGQQALATDSVAGAQRFANGAGRGGSFTDI